MRKNPHDRILREKFKKQHLSTVPKGVFGRVDFREDERERERERERENEEEKLFGGYLVGRR